MQTTDTAGARRGGSERSGSRSPGMAEECGCSGAGLIRPSDLSRGAGVRGAGTSSTGHARF